MITPASNDPEPRILSDGIFISSYQGRTLTWEFHPDDVTSVSIYRDGVQMHEVVVTLNREFDLVETMSGLSELNARLSRELRTNLTGIPGASVSARGVVLWPAHLAGGALWEFYVIGEDGLASYVPADAPQALRNLCRPLRREMARFAKPHLPHGFPQPLIERGFAYHGEIGWRRDDALAAAEWVRANGGTIVETELWVVKNAVVCPHIQTVSGPIALHRWSTTWPRETWEAFASRSLHETSVFIRQFQWPKDTLEPAEQDVRFCLTWVWKEMLEEDNFKFPKEE
jgi:hypothetical protein